jgi:DNA-directed RNA polymerase subunit M/transcription elongation factor TFIIS
VTPSASHPDSARSRPAHAGATCVKCGASKGVVVSYHTFSAGVRGCPYGSFSTRMTEHLHYTCQTCGFDWTEPTKDAA